MGKFLGFFFLALALACVPSSEAKARLLASKALLNEQTVEKKDLTIRYSIYNIGTSPAQSVVLDDSSFPPEEFDVVQGMLSARWERIAQNSNVTHNVILQAKEPGRYNISWARLTYTANDGEEQVSYTSAPGTMVVSKYEEFSRKYELHVMEWLAFVAMSTPTVVLPLILWYRSYSKYEALKTKKA